MKVKLAVDIDGTLSRWPKILWELLWAFPDHVLLAGAIPSHGKAQTVAATSAEAYGELRRKQLEKIGVLTWKPKIVVFVGENEDELGLKKAEWCRDNRVQLLIDNTEQYCESVRRISPGTVVMRVMP